MQTAYRRHLDSWNKVIYAIPSFVSVSLLWEVNGRFWRGPAWLENDIPLVVLRPPTWSASHLKSDNSFLSERYSKHCPGQWRSRVYTTNTCLSNYTCALHTVANSMINNATCSIQTITTSHHNVHESIALAHVVILICSHIPWELAASSYHSLVALSTCVAFHWKVTLGYLYFYGEKCKFDVNAPVSSSGTRSWVLCLRFPSLHLNWEFAV